MFNIDLIRIRYFYVTADGGVSICSEEYTIFAISYRIIRCICFIV